MHVPSQLLGSVWISCENEIISIIKSFLRQFLKKKLLFLHNKLLPCMHLITTNGVHYLTLHWQQNPKVNSSISEGGKKSSKTVHLSIYVLITMFQIPILQSLGNRLLFNCIHRTREKNRLILKVMIIDASNIKNP